MFGVYRVHKNGSCTYVPRSATHNEKLATEIAADLTAGQYVRPDGSIGTCKPYPHVAKPIIPVS